jgi:selenide,water dikinase
LRHIPKADDPNLLIGVDTSDDAAVYKIDENTAIIETLDFFTPIVDDPYEFGQIAAANSLSDIYAMGGSPVFALNIVCFPVCLPMEILGEIIRGGSDKVREAGAYIVGGHSIDDKEPKYGLAVTGTVHPERIMANSTARPGDLLVLTKSLGVGIINTAVKGGIASPKNKSDAVESMTYLNKYASEIIRKYNISACTDITGFGLLGHLYEMVSGSHVSANVHYDGLAVINGAQDFAKMGIIPQGAYRNRQYLQGKCSFAHGFEEFKKDILFDPQTSGGLLVSVERDQAAALLDELRSIKTPCSFVGEITEEREYSIHVD